MNSRAPTTPAAPRTRDGWLRWGAIGLGLLATIVVARRFPVSDALQWVRGQGAAAPILFVLLYAAACVAFVPGSILTLGAGAVFGPVLGTAWVSAGSTLGAALAFLLGRFVARDAIARRFGNDPRFRAIDEAVAREGWKIVALLRLSPAFPFTLLNYALGLTRVRFRDYVVASWIGMMPGTVLFVYLGSVLGEALPRGGATRPTRTPAEWALYAVGLAATIAVTVVVTRLARRALQQRIG
ncbi:MAG: TVP38/TMEM64 family protein [Verrucomicrobia bacterium]|nr:MAG: TVP38/TMEM64 family protein [Verrucomicrobiota bacterium]